MHAGVFLKGSCGSLNYAAPELLCKDCWYDGPAVDVWSLGVVLYALLCNSLPFDESHPEQLARAIKSRSYCMPNFFSLPAIDLIGRSLLVIDSAKRARIHEVHDHSWVQQCPPAELGRKTVQMTNAEMKSATQISCAISEKPSFVKECDELQRCAMAIASTFSSASTAASDSDIYPHTVHDADVFKLDAAFS
jgi:serine/threonine protein kinase